MSYLDVVVAIEGSSSQQRPHRVSSFPDQSVLLSPSSFSKAQILRWQHKRQGAPLQPASKRGSSARPSTSGGAQQDGDNSSNRRPQLLLTLEDASQEPAALAILKMLYMVKPVRELLAELMQKQQLQVAMLADMWELPDISTAALSALTQALAEQKLEPAMLEELLHLPAVPDGLLSFQRHVLLSVLGDLEAVWADAALQEMLLELPLEAMELLLSCDELKVASEDTALYTASAYVESLDDGLQGQACERLLPHIRCQHLSLPWVVAAEANLLLRTDRLQPHLATLLAMRAADPSYKVSQKDLNSSYSGTPITSGAPKSWAMPQRIIQLVSAVQLTWQLDMAELREAAACSKAEQCGVVFKSPTSTPPMGGIAFACAVKCDWGPGSQGLNIGLYSKPCNLLEGMLCFYDFTIQVNAFSVKGSAVMVAGGKLWGKKDFFRLGVCSVGWDEEKWAAKGLPCSGVLEIKMKMKNVPHARRAA